MTNILDQRITWQEMNEIGEDWALRLYRSQDNRTDEQIHDDAHAAALQNVPGGKWEDGPEA